SRSSPYGVLWRGNSARNEAYLTRVLHPLGSSFDLVQCNRSDVGHLKAMKNAERPILDVTLRPRRQLTLPPQVCEALGLEVGDRLEVSLTEEGMLVKPKKRLALNALAEIQRAFQQSGVTEAELQTEGRRVREELSRSRYGKA